MTDRPPESGLREPLRGRARECVQLDGLIAAVQGGEGRSLVLRGEAGIGKTALLEYLVAAASALTVVRAAGVESEMELAFASLHQLCVPMLDRLTRLPAPQRQALEIVFGLSAGARAGSVPRRPRRAEPALRGGRGAAAAVRRRRRAVAGSGVGADARVRGPAPAGRAGRDRVRGPRTRRELQHLSELEVDGLRDGDARALLDSAVPSMLDERVARSDHRGDAGQPAGAARAAAGLDADAAGGWLRDAEAALSGRIEESYIRRLEILPDDARRLLLLAAAEPVGDPLLLRRASERSGSASPRSTRTEGLLALGSA